VDVRDMPQSELRSMLGYVPQKGVLFSGTIDSNLRFGGEDISEEDARSAARIAQATEFIEAKPEGYESPIAQGGSNVSGGQKQRLSIARAIACRPKIYLFDDSFSALDYKTDVALRRALKEETGDSTVIIVAQRISTVLHANQILVLDEGRIVGKGTHAQLMESCPEYQEIARSQLSNKELNLKGGEN
ncbi:MAG: ATP-binding cassette domain-containing protein, partial [Gemmiger sp.]